MPSVVKYWIAELSWKQQTVILSALRGCDGKSKEDISKPITRYFRNLVLENADNSSTFMRTVDKCEIALMKTHFKTLLGDIDNYQMHFILHLFHAIEIVGYKCPDPEIKKFCHLRYLEFCETLHLKPEYEPENDARLADKTDVFAV
jgi:hypothetical protein